MRFTYDLYWSQFLGLKPRTSVRQIPLSILEDKKRYEDVEIQNRFLYKNAFNCALGLGDEISFSGT